MVVIGSLCTTPFKLNTLQRCRDETSPRPRNIDTPQITTPSLFVCREAPLLSCVAYITRPATYIPSFLPTGQISNQFEDETYLDPSANMSRPAYTEAFLLESTPRYSVDQPQSDCLSEPSDLSLFSTVLLVVALAVGGAFFIMAMACLLGEDHNTGKLLL